MYFRPIWIICSVCLAGIVSGRVFANEGHWMFGDQFEDGRNREVENRYRLGFGIGNPSVSSHVLCPSSRSLCTCTILFATGFVSIGCSVSYLFILNCKFRLISLYMKM